ncbi:MAG: T9SS type A sorting domain-containing protein [Candidatus Eisenbacteria bacterium]|uniref:T9SS type A sorting domain-containing protein n=1 Tax=Eiseniibacteriota bacterium TaxID=2212470 RepID=A0A933W422_UNCEI|nr:T9SS type A sorting domain-containing protein [Candidatus Eisenbacteria bacterium]
MRRASHPSLLLSAFLLLSATAARAQVADPNLWVTDGVVNTTFLDGNKLYLGGDFEYVGPQTGAWASVARPGYRPYSTPPRVEGTVYCSASDGAGGWFVGGSFSRINGATRQNLAHFRADGTLDGWAPNPSAPVRALLRMNGRLYVGGDFLVIASLGRQRLAAFDIASLALLSWNPGALGGSVLALAASGNRVYLGGDFTSVGATARNRIAAVDTLTGALVVWDPNANGTVRTIVATPYQVYVGGSFTNIAGTARNRLAALKPATATVYALDPNCDGDVNALALRGAQLYVVGGFSTIAGSARLSAASVDTASATPSAWAPVLYGRVNAIAFDDFYAYLGGAIDVFDGGYIRQGMLVVDAEGTGGLRSAAAPADGEVHTLQVDARDLFAGGAFKSFGGVRRTHLAALDLTTGQATDWAPQANGPVTAVLRGGAHVYAAGPFSYVGGASRFFVAQLDTSGGAATNWNANPDSAVMCMAYGNGVLYLGGTFRSIQFSTNLRNRLAAVNLTTGAMTAFNPNVTSSGNAYTYVNTMHLYGSLLYFGGKFTGVGTATRGNLAAVDASTGAWDVWRPTSNKIKQVQRVGDRVYVANDNPGTPGYFLMTDPTGPGVFSDNWFPDSSVAAFAISGPHVYMAGGFSMLYDSTRSGLGQSLLNGYVATGWNPAPDVRDVRTLAISGTSVIAGGAFSAMRQQPVRGLARLWPAPVSPPAVSVLKPNGGERLRRGTTYRVTWSATASTPGVQSVDISYSTAGAGGPWTLVGAGVPNTGGYDFVVPTSVIAGTTGLIRVQARDWTGQVTADVSNASFTFDSGTLDAPGGPVAAFAMDPIAPNPARGATPLRFALPHRADVRVSVLDVQGREVAVLADGAFEAGRHAVTLDGARLSPGLFFVRVQSGGVSLARRVAIVK